MSSPEIKPIVIAQTWKERGVVLLAAHYDDEVLSWKLINCLC